MSHLTIDELAQKIGITAFPEEYRDFYDEVMQDFDAHGCAYTNPEYYDYLHDRYSVLDSYLDLYKKAADEIGRDEYLSRALALLCYSLKDADVRGGKKELLKLPQRDGDFAYEMFEALASASELEISYDILKKRNLPADILKKTLALPENGIPSFTMRHENRPGYALLHWFQLAIDGKLFELGRLQYEIFCGFEGAACVFRNKGGEEMALASNLPVHRSGFALGSKYYEDEEGSWVATITETDSSYEGYPLNERGFVINNIVSLSKNEWDKVLSPGDPVISVHIPATGSLIAEKIDASLQAATHFFRTYYPDYEYKAFVCYSWLMDPQLVDLLGPDSNISKFNMRFQKVTGKSNGNDVFNFVFLKPDMNFSLEELPENTRLEKALKKHYLDGKAIYGMAGYFFER